MIPSQLKLKIQNFLMEKLLLSHKAMLFAWLFWERGVTDHVFWRNFLFVLIQLLVCHSGNYQWLKPRSSATCRFFLRSNNLNLTKSQTQNCFLYFEVQRSPSLDKILTTLKQVPKFLLDLVRSALHPRAGEQADSQLFRQPVTVQLLPHTVLARCGFYYEAMALGQL